MESVATASVSTIEPSKDTRLTFKVEGMTCENCVRHAREAILALPGIRSVQVSLDTSRAQVQWISARDINVQALLSALLKAGFHATLIEEKTILQIDGMSCQNCVRHVKEALGSVPGTAQIVVSLDQGQAVVRWDKHVTPDTNALIAAIASVGFTARESAMAHDVAEPRFSNLLQGWRFNVVIGGFALVPLMVGEWVFGWGHQTGFQWLAMVLATLVQSLCGYRFYRGAWLQFKAGASNMDTLVSLGSTTAYAYSLWLLLSGAKGHLFFMESTAIITLISVGHWLESITSTRASAAMRQLMNLAPPMARRMNPDQSEEEIPVEQLALGDLLVLRPGDRIPVDAEVMEGQSAVDESMLTGESVPVDKNRGHQLFAGTVNQNGRLLARTLALGHDTVLAQIISAVERAQNSRASIQRLADRVSNIFVPLVIACAGITGTLWILAPSQMENLHHLLASFWGYATAPDHALSMGIISAVGVLIVACPCAMGIATPVAIMAGTNAAASRGILIRDAIALEKSGTITSVVFDKTGTLTEGKLAVAGRLDLTHTTADMPSIMEIAASLASRSNHPVSQCLAAYTQRRITVAHWKEIRGCGVEGVVPWGGNEHLTVRLGSLQWLSEHHVDLTSGAKFIKEWSAKGATLLGITSDHHLFGLFALRDQLKSGASEIVSELAHQGKNVFLITGDRQVTAHEMARQAGIPIDHVFADVLPSKKADIIQQLQSQGLKVAFVGDGINDAPALEQADLGIAVGKASDIARESADIILLKTDIHAIPEALALAQKTLRIIKQNLFWAFFYNVAAIPLAAIGFLSPILCAVAMGLSDLVVIGNALRLRRMRWAHKSL